jgi:hypothetical protein
MSEEKKNYIVQNENAILRDVAGVLEAMETIIEYKVFEVIRDGKKLFSFRVRGLDDSEFERCRDQATKVAKDRRLGNLAVPREFNSAKFNSLVIYAATHPDDKKAIWDNKDLWAKADVVTGWQLVDKVLKRGEKEKCIELIEELSGYADEDAETTDETLKNS